MQMRAFILSVETYYCTDLGQLNDCNNTLFLKVSKVSVHIRTV